jgi:hypothetical protein
MNDPELRTAQERKQDTLAMLTTPEIDVWVATASTSGTGEPTAHLVPLSLAWLDDRVVLALASNSVTARGLAATGRTRLGLGPTRDVTMIDAIVESTVSVEQAPSELAVGYAAQADWDPRDDPEGYVYVVLRPTRIQSWREVNEIPTRTLKRSGEWLV